MSIYLIDLSVDVDATADVNTVVAELQKPGASIWTSKRLYRKQWL